MVRVRSGGAQDGAWLRSAVHRRLRVKAGLHVVLIERYRTVGLELTAEETEASRGGQDRGATWTAPVSKWLASGGFELPR
jgi:hypothetical protein